MNFATEVNFFAHEGTRAINAPAYQATALNAPFIFDDIRQSSTSGQMWRNIKNIYQAPKLRSRLRNFGQSNKNLGTAMVFRAIPLITVCRKCPRFVRYMVLLKMYCPMTRQRTWPNLALRPLPRRAAAQRFRDFRRYRGPI